MNSSFSFVHFVKKFTDTELIYTTAGAVFCVLFSTNRDKERFYKSAEVALILPLKQLYKVAPQLYSFHEVNAKLATCLN